MKIPQILIILRNKITSLLSSILKTHPINPFFPSKEIIAPISDSNDFQFSFVWNSREKGEANRTTNWSMNKHAQFSIQKRSWWWSFSIDHNPAWNQYPRTAKSRGISVIEITSFSISLFLPLSLPAECWKSGERVYDNIYRRCCCCCFKSRNKIGNERVFALR